MKIYAKSANCSCKDNKSYLTLSRYLKKIFIKSYYDKRTNFSIY